MMSWILEKLGVFLELPILPPEIHYEILDRVSYDKIGNMRCICKNWKQHIDDGNYQSIVDFYSTINVWPDVIIDLPMQKIGLDIKIRFGDGIFVQSGDIIDYRYWLRNKNISQLSIMDDMITHVLMNNYGRYSLTRNLFFSRDLYIDVNGKVSTVRFDYDPSAKIINADDKQVKIYANKCYYTYNIIEDTLESTSIPNLENVNDIHINGDVFYLLMHDYIIVRKSGVNIGIIHLPSYECGFGNDYFVVKHENRLLFWFKR